MIAFLLPHSTRLDFHTALLLYRAMPLANWYELMLQLITSVLWYPAAVTCSIFCGVQHPHYDHEDASAEIARLTILHKCRKRAAEDETPLRQIFDDECRASTSGGHNVAFAEIESSMYKRRRLAMPSLPNTPQSSDATVAASRFAQLGLSVFYRGQVEGGNADTALVFASDRQLEQLRPAHLIHVDSTFRVVPSLYYQLFTVFVPHADYTFPVVYALMTRKTTALYKAVLQKVHELIPEFQPSQVIADFEEAPTTAVREVFGDQVTVSGCWFHYAQAVMKRLKKIGLTEAYRHDDDTQVLFRCLIALPLLPVADIVPAFQEVQEIVKDDSDVKTQLRQLCSYVERQWILKATIGSARLSVRDNTSRTNNAVESFHAGLRGRVKVAHPNLFTFLGHLQRTTTDCETEMERVSRGMIIRRGKKRTNLVNDARIKACMSRYDNGAYSRMQFLRAVSHSLGSHTLCNDTGSSASDNDDDADDDVQSDDAAVADHVPPVVAAAEPASQDLCDVCLVQDRDTRQCLVPCGHQRFCSSCIEQVSQEARGCPICRAPINMVMRLY